MSDYTQGLLSKANAAAAEPYQTYGGPRVAGFNADQTKSFADTEANVGKYTPNVGSAIDMATSAGNSGATAAAAPYMAGANKTYTGGNVSQYMDPYIGNVIDRSTQLANRNFNEKIMPGLNNEFTASGQFGSSAHQREADRAARDLTEGVQSNAGAMLSGAYTSGANVFGADTNRQGALAQTAGSIAQQQAAQQLAASGQVGSLAQIGQGMGLKDTAALNAVGQQQQGQAQTNLDTAYNDFTAQRDYPKTQLDWMSSIIRGMPAPVSQQNTQVGPLQGAKMGDSQASQLGSLATGLGSMYSAVTGP